MSLLYLYFLSPKLFLHFINTQQDILKILENKSLQEIALFITSIKQTFFEKISELSQKELEDTYIYKKTN